MNTEERTTGTPAMFRASWSWKGGGLAGLVATIAMGVAISVMDIETLRLAIAGLYGLEGNLVAGWIAHLIHGTIFGIVFAAFLTEPVLYLVGERVWKSTIAGAVYGLVLSVIGAGILMPIWLNAVGFPFPPSLPNVTASSLIWHLIYGTGLGVLFPFVKEL